MLDRARFWETPAVDGKACLDGVVFILERIRHGRYHAVFCWSPEEGSLRNLFGAIASIGESVLHETVNHPG
jgi:hypothetical protein